MGTLNSVIHIRYIYPFLWLGLITHSNNSLSKPTK